MKASPRRLLRWTGTLIAVGSAAWHSLHAVTAWQAWRTWAVNDPSLADFYWAQLEIELLLVTLCLTAAVLIWRLLREGQPSAAVSPLI